MVSISKLGLLSILICASLQGIIVESNSIGIIAEICAEQPKGTYVILDIDHTIGKCVLKPTFKPWFTQVLNFGSSSSMLDRLQHVLRLKSMEPGTVPMIKQLQKDQVPVIVLTARHGNVVESTLAHLVGLDLDFSQGIKDLAEHDIALVDLKPAHFQKGIIYCCRQDKGHVLTQFFKQNNIKPDRVIFADDLLVNVESVNKALTEQGIECVGIHYTRKKKQGIRRLTRGIKSIFKKKRN